MTSLLTADANVRTDSKIICSPRVAMTDAKTRIPCKSLLNSDCPLQKIRVIFHMYLDRKVKGSKLIGRACYLKQVPFMPSCIRSEHKYSGLLCPSRIVVGNIISGKENHYAVKTIPNIKLPTRKNHNKKWSHCNQEFCEDVLLICGSYPL